MNEAETLSARKVNEISDGLFGKRLSDSDVAAVSGLLNALASETRACRAMPAGDDEPATIYRAEGEAAA